MHTTANQCRAEGGSGLPKCSFTIKLKSSHMFLDPLCFAMWDKIKSMENLLPLTSQVKETGSPSLLLRSIHQCVMLVKQN